ncbi:MAG: sigma-70 family RNA polymerase sigma factor [Bacteroidales bacterium]|nr:sigma-70 family RNA polymerase sigma factor [Bacteroidales bacterium]
MTTDRRQLDYQLVCDARDHGSGRAYASLMASYRRPLYLLLLRMTRNTTTADDLTVETFSKAFLQLHRYAPTGSFSAWLYSIGVNTYLDHLRKRQPDTVSLNEMQRNGEGDFVEYQIPSGQPNPEEALMRMQRDEALKEVVAQLKEPYRQMVELRYYEDLSYEEIAKRMHLPMGTVKVRLARAKSLLSAIAKRKSINFENNHFIQ